MRRALSTLFEALVTAGECFWPKATPVTPAALHYYESVLEEERR